MNRRPGHTPQLPPAVDALAGMAIAPAWTAIAISAVRPSAILTSLIVSNLVIFIGCPSPLAGQQPGRRPNGPAVSLTSIGVRSGPGLTSPRRRQRAAGRPTGQNRIGRKPKAKALLPLRRQASRG